MTPHPQALPSDASDLLHGILRLRRDVQAPTGVSQANSSLDAIRTVHDLPEHALELHAFSSMDAATAFSEGVEASGTQTVASSGAIGPGGLCVILARFSQDRPAASDLGAAVPLIGHPVARIAHEAGRRAEASRKRTAVNEATVAMWQAPLRGMPQPRAQADGELRWRMADVSIDTDGEAWVAGTFDPDPQPSGDQALHVEHQVHLSRSSDGTIRAILSASSSGIACSPSITRWRREEMSAAVHEAGWSETGDGPWAPTWSGKHGADLQRALLSVPAMVAKLRILITRAVWIERAVELGRSPQARLVLEAMGADEGARIRMGTMGGAKPHHLEGSASGLRPSARVVEAMIDAGLLHRVVSSLMTLSELGRELARSLPDLLRDAADRTLPTPPVDSPAATGPV